MSLGAILKFIVKHPMNRGQRARAVGRFLRWQLASRLLPFPIAVPFVDQLKLFMERGMTGATGNFYCGLHEAEDMAFILHFMRPGDVFYDVGANVGSYSLLAAAANVEKIIGFEPSTLTGTKYRRNVDVNALRDVVSIHHVALGEGVGELTFTQGLDTTNHVVAAGEESGEAEVVPVRRFDEFFIRGRPSFIKMDVEGFESQVLAGAGEALSDTSLMGLLIENNGSGNRYGAGAGILDIIRSKGFTDFRYDPWNRVLAPGSGGKSTGNLLFLKDGASASERVRAARKFKLVNGWI